MSRNDVLKAKQDRDAAKVRALNFDNLATLDAASAYAGCHPRTLRRMIAAGELTGYRVKGTKLIRVDLSELFTVIPTASGL